MLQRLYSSLISTMVMSWLTSLPRWPILKNRSVNDMLPIACLSGSNTGRLITTTKVSASSNRANSVIMQHQSYY